jgi:hypothetical protein
MKISSWFDRSHPKESTWTEARSDEEPIRAEVYALERLQAFAVELAVSHEIATTTGKGRDLLARLDDNRRKLVSVYNSLTEVMRFDRQLTPAAEWLIDNFHIVEEQLREAREDLPQSYYKQLPKLASGIFSGYPRIYHLAFEVVRHTDNRLDKHTLIAFLDSYQEHTPLLMGELWAFPISLRLALIENLRRFAVLTSQALSDRRTAEQFAQNWSEINDDNFAEELAALSKAVGGSVSSEKYSPPLVVEVGKKLRDGNRFMSIALETIEKKLLREGETLEHLTHREHNRQAAAQISVANIITSMRLLSTLDWREFFESVSLVDRSLQKDPAGAFAEMDFKTRDLYRHNIERIARQTKATEIEIADRAIDFARKSSQDQTIDPARRRSHVGFFLKDPTGQTELERAFDYHPTLGDKSRRFLYRYPAFLYLALITLLTVVVIASFALLSLRWSGYSFDSLPWSLLIVGVLLALIPASELAIAVANRLTNLFLKPRPLPKMNFQNGIPERARTMVVIPTMLTSEAAITELCDRLEVCFLANRDDQLYFGLLGDLADASDETVPEDERLRKKARTKIEKLNRKYRGSNQTKRFVFLSRKRIWNVGANKWICRERKRGNLQEFNSLLRGERETGFVFPEKIDFAFLQTIRYVITLDADTQLPRDAARKLVGTIEHPLNRPYFDRSDERSEHAIQSDIF